MTIRGNMTYMYDILFLLSYFIYICTMEKKDKKETAISLIQPNKVTTARYNYTAREEDILTLMVDAIQSHMTRDRIIQRDLFNQPMIVIDTKDVGSKHKSDYLKAAELLRKKDFSFEWKNPKDGKTRKTVGSLIAAHHDVRQTSIIEITINTWAIPYLLYWGKGIGGTIYNKTIALTLKGQYAKRLYKLCKRWEGKGGFSMSIEDFRKMLHIENKYILNGDLKKRVLEKSKKQLKEKADIYFEYSLEKIGGSRSYNQINLKIFGNNKNVRQDKKTEIYQIVYNIIALAFPVYKSSKAVDITDKLADNPDTLEQAYRRLTKLRNELNSGEKDLIDVIRLIKHILKTDYNIL